MGAGLTKSQRRYYANKGLRNLKRKYGGRLKGGQLHFKCGWVSPKWLIASNAEMALDFKIVKRRRGKSQIGDVIDTASDHYWNEQSLAKSIKRIKGVRKRR